MTDEQIVKILRRDGYHCAARRMEELVEVDKVTGQLFYSSNIHCFIFAP